ncbi:MAG TPA: phospholipase D family protein, partial [Caldisericia bacterium]|nr:phospholipase D family protein [Caldisericia bacterium]
SLTKLKELIEDKNTKRIWIEMYELTDSDILDSLKKRAEEKDIDIKIILDYRQHNDYAESDNAKYSRMVDFECNLENARNNKNCEVRWWQFCNDNYQKLHRKIFLFGKDTIWIGSSNISHYGLYDKNKEINLKIVDSKLASEFEEIFKKDWCDPDKNICQLVENLEEPCPKQP